MYIHFMLCTPTNKLMTKSLLSHRSLMYLYVFSDHTVCDLIYCNIDKKKFKRYLLLKSNTMMKVLKITSYSCPFLTLVTVRVMFH